jgi:hypothetical protein
MMRLREGYIKAGLLVFGALTMTMIGAVFAPQPMLRATFGADFSNPLALMIVRSWGTLIALVGGVMIYAAFHPEQRKVLVFVAMTSKMIFLALLIGFGTQYMAAAAGVIIADMAAIAFMAASLMAVREVQ